MRSPPERVRSLPERLRYINCRNANWKLVQLCRSVLRAVFDVFHFVSARLVHGVSFSFVLHERSQTVGENIAKKPPTFKNISGALPHRINPPNLVCASVQAVPLRIRRWRFYFQPGPRGTGVQLRLQRSNARNQKSTSPSHSCGEQKPLKSNLRCENKQRVASLRQRESRAIFGWPPVGRSASWKRKKKLRLRFVWSSDQNDETTQNFKRTSAIFSCHGNASGAHAYMSMYESLCLRSPILAARARPSCTRSRPDRVWSLQLRSDHRPHTAGPGGVPLSCS